MSQVEKVAGPDELPDLGRKSLLLDDDIPVLLFRVGTAYYCVEDVCTHDGQPLTSGPFDGHRLTCPRHGAMFDITNGKPTKMPATEPIRTFPAELRPDGVYVTTDG